MAAPFWHSDSDFGSASVGNYNFEFALRCASALRKFDGAQFHPFL